MPCVQFDRLAVNQRNGRGDAMNDHAIDRDLSVLGSVAEGARVARPLGNREVQIVKNVARVGVTGCGARI